VSVGLKAIQKCAEQYLALAMGFARSLQAPPYPPETVHKLRTHLRRLQAYAEFSERPVAAARLDHCVKWLSGLRTLDVFRRYLCRRGLGAQDLRRVDEAIREQERSVAQAGYLEAIRAVLARTSISRIRRSAASMSARLDSLGRNHAARLADALRGLSPEATRKELHHLRLLVKSLRYQEEIAQETAWGNSRRLGALKRLQRTLGDYCDLDQFRRLAKKMDLACRTEIKKEYRRYRTRARAVVRRLGPPSGLPTDEEI
jgi:CHAD domain-containing protein